MLNENCFYYYYFIFIFIFAVELFDLAHKLNWIEWIEFEQLLQKVLASHNSQMLDLFLFSVSLVSSISKILHTLFILWVFAFNQETFFL